MTKIQKGTEVWFFQMWNRSTNKVSATRLTIQSLGKKQGTATRVEDGKFVHDRIYANQYGDLVAVADMPDPTAEGLRRAALQREAEIAHHANCVHGYHLSYNGEDQYGYCAAMKKDCEVVINSAPAVVIR